MLKVDWQARELWADALPQSIFIVECQQRIENVTSLEVSGLNVTYARITNDVINRDFGNCFPSSDSIPSSVRDERHEDT